MHLVNRLRRNKKLSQNEILYSLFRKMQCELMTFKWLDKVVNLRIRVQVSWDVVTPYWKNLVNSKLKIRGLCYVI